MQVNIDIAPKVLESQLVDLFALANTKTTLAGIPYSIASSATYPEWISGNSYSIGNLVSYRGNIFYSLANSNTHPPSDPSYWKGVLDRGAYNNATAYTTHDLVTYGGYNWISTASQTGNPPLTSATPPVPNSGWIQLWLSAFNRLRANLINGATGKLAAKKLKSGITTSGPWPVSGVGTTTLSGDFGQVSILFPETSSSETLTLVSKNGSNGTTNKKNSPSFAYLKIVIGGNVPVTFTGAFAVSVQATGFSSTVTPDPISLVVDSENTFPNITWTPVPGYGGYLYYCDFNGVTIQPGTYVIAIKMLGSTLDYGSGTGVIATGMRIGFIGSPGPALYSTTLSMLKYRADHLYVPGTGSGGAAEINLSFMAQTNYPAIHNSKQIKRIGALEDANRTGFGLYVWAVQEVSPEEDSEGSPVNAWTSTAAGIFFCTTKAIRDLKMMLHDSMPWNLFLRPDGTFPSTSEGPAQNLSQPYTVGTSAPYNYARAYAVPWEKQNNPPRWVAGTFYSKGFQIQDSNGHLQTVTTAGKSGTTEPTWPTSAGATIADGTITWQLTFNRTAALLPARARMFSVPCYPVIWDQDTWQANTAVALGQKIMDTNGEIRICSLAGTTGGTQPSWGSGGSASIVSPNWGMEGTAAEITDNTAKWKPYFAGFNPRGWMIYRININKISANSSSVAAGSGSTGAGAGSPGAGSTNVSVDIGCYRSGAFVLLGTFQTGSSVTAKWPIFTNTPLVYRCAERVDIQAQIIACGNSFTTGGSVGYPMCGAYYNDTEALLNLIL